MNTHVTRTAARTLSLTIITVSLLAAMTGCDTGGGGTTPNPCTENDCQEQCSDCPPGTECVSDGTCRETPPERCQPSCGDQMCGDDGCGGSCGTCTGGTTCDGRGCTTPLGPGTQCTANCTGRDCGADGCGGACGECDAAGVCDAAGQCVAPPASTCQSGLEGCSTLPGTGQRACAYFDVAADAWARDPQCQQPYALGDPARPWGQDAHNAHYSSQRQFVAVDAAVTLDAVTGLLWQRCSYGIDRADCAATAPTFTFDEATHPSTGPCSQLAAAGYGGRTDWRLPTPLESLTVRNWQDTTWLPTFPADNNPSWTGAASPVDAASAMVITWSDLRSVPREELRAVRCVAGTSIPRGEFQEAAGGALTDTATGLTWARCPLGEHYDAGTGGCVGLADQLLWEDGLASCSGLDQAGSLDWRMPSLIELASLLDYDSSDLIDRGAFPSVTGRLWTSTAGVNSGRPMAVRFEDGGIFTEQWVGYQHPVLCVRSEPVAAPAHSSVPAGPGTCMEVGNCIQQCPSQDAGCQLACQATASDGALAAYAAYASCEAMHCSDVSQPSGLSPSSRLECLTSNCFDELYGCMVEEPGAGSCVDTLKCIDGCAFDAACIDACWSVGTKPAMQDALELTICISEACMADPVAGCSEAAKTGACAGETTACLEGDAPAPVECYAAGCSGQVCSSDQFATTTCEWEDHYVCYAQADCGPHGPGGTCAWKDTPDLASCMAANP